jgi:inhibitor of cysteine peptidase
MKRVFWIIFIFFAFSCIAMAAPKKKFLNDGDADSTITLDQSSVAVIELWTNPSTGYGWFPQEPYGENIEILGSEFESSEPGLKGAWGKEKIYVIGKAKGKSELVMQYRRGWLDEKGAVDTLTFNFKTKAPFRESFSVPSNDVEIDPTPVQSDTGAKLGLPRSFNWCDQGGCTPIKDQGTCGSCWAFATVAPLESAIKLNDGIVVDLSEQYLVSCNSNGWGCNGGLWAHDYHLSKKVNNQSEAGAVFEADFAYKGRDLYCGKNYKKQYQLASWKYVCGNAYCTPTTTELKQAIYEHGPLTVAVCVNYSFQFYSGGVFTGPSCSSLNHGVTLVGWDDSNGCWIMRNEWGAGWGENGYMRIKYGVSGIGSEACYVTYKSAPDAGDGDGGDGGGGGGDDDEITNGQTISDLSASAGEWLYYYIDVPEGVSTLTADVETKDFWSIFSGSKFSIYLQHGAKPTLTEYDSKTARWRSVDTCVSNSPASGRWYIGIYGKGLSGFTGASLTASYN